MEQIMKNIPLDLQDEKFKGLQANYHTHTKRCMHAVGEDREYVESAIEAGFNILGFSDHTPQVFKDGYVSGMRMRASELEQYVDSVLNLRREYASDITVMLGLETEYFPELFDGLIKLIESYPFDYMIMGQHWLYRECRETVVTKERTEEAFLKSYVEQVIEGMRTGYFTYLAHPDVINFTGDKTIYRKYMKRLAAELKTLGIPLEINGLGYRENRFYPNPCFWEIVSELGNDCVIGIDAHSPGALLNAECRNGCLGFAEKYGLNVLNIHH